MLLLDTSVLIDALTGPMRSMHHLESLIRAGVRPCVSTVVLYEWWRGPRTERELRLQEVLVPSSGALPFTSQEAQQSALLYRSIGRPRGREIDICIASFAITRDWPLWTLNRQDFKDITPLHLWTPGLAS